MFSSPAYAATGGAASGGAASFFVQIFPLVLIFIIFYFLLIRPQQRRMKDHQRMVADVKVARHRDHLRRPDRQGDQGRGQ